MNKEPLDMGLAIVISMAIDFRGKRKGIVTEITGTDVTELKVVDETNNKLKRRRFYCAWVIILIAIGIGFLGRFLFSTFILFFGFALVFGKRQHLVKNTLIAVGVNVLVPGRGEMKGFPPYDLWHRVKANTSPVLGPGDK